MIIQYVREKDIYLELKENRDPFGVVVCTGLNEQGNPKIGWSLKHSRDKFNKKTALKIAVNRAEYFQTGEEMLDLLGAKAGYYGEKRGKNAERMRKFTALVNVANRVYDRARKHYGEV